MTNNPFNSLSDVLTPGEIAEMDQYSADLRGWTEGLIKIFADSIRSGGTPQFTTYGVMVGILIPPDAINLAFAQLLIEIAHDRVNRERGLSLDDGA